MRGILLIVTFTVLSGIWGEAQTLGDIGRKERARKQGAQTRITITNESVNYPIPVPAPETGSPKIELPAAEQSPVIVQKAPVITPFLIEEPSIPEIQRPIQLSPLEVEPPPVEPPVPPARDETWWRMAFQEARDGLKKAEDRVILLQVALNRARLDQLEATPGDSRARGGAEIVRLTNELDSAQKDVAKARRSISELEEDLRQSGGPLTWTR